MNNTTETPLVTVIEPTRGWRVIAWRELHEYRDLLWLMVWRDIVARYKQTVLGPLWYVVQPILTTVVFMIIFSRVARIPTNGVPSSLFYLSGLLVWNYFAMTFQSTASTFASNTAIFGKIYFPRLIVPLAAMISNLAAVVIQLAIFAAVYLLEKAGPRGHSFGVTGSIWLFPLVFAEVALFSLGIGLWLAAVTAKFRDLAVLTTFLIQLWMYATPVIYPLSRVPARWYAVAAINPMTFPLEAVREMLLGGGTVTLPLGAISVALTLVILLGGLVIFRRSEKTFVDVI